jgi:hypothetical protein
MDRYLSLMEKTERRRLTFWAVIFILLGIASVLTLTPEQFTELLSFFKEIITHLIIGS